MLVLGYRINNALDPSSDLVCISTESIAKHTAIIAQSGSGKSFFLGRFVEEILLRTKARILLLDPNGDFLRVADVVGDSLWEDNRWDPVGRKGLLTHEKQRSEFDLPWQRVSKRIRGGPLVEASGHEVLSIHWPSTDGKMIASGFDTSDHYELVNCHEVVKAIGLLYSRLCEMTKPQRPESLLRVCDDLMRSPIDIEGRLKDLFDIDKIASEIASKETGSSKLTEAMVAYASQRAMGEMKEALEKAVKLSKNIQSQQKDYYFRRASSIAASRIFCTDTVAPDEIAPRLDVIDVSSLTDEEPRQFAVNAVVAHEVERSIREWRTAMSMPPEHDDRVPTFIVVDEAHNLMPAEPSNSNSTVLRDQFLTIAAEGRKFGLFLIVVSQRPDKLDPRILSECENKVVMRLGSESVLNKTSELLGLEDVPKKQLAKVLDFPQGRAMLCGPWILDTHTSIYGAARRTFEGGRNLRSRYWSIPEEDTTSSSESEPQSKSSSKPKKKK
jgi:hypothetical protein